MVDRFAVASSELLGTGREYLEKYLRTGGVISVTDDGAKQGWAPSSDANWRKAHIVIRLGSTTGLLIRGFKAEPSEPDFVKEKIIFNKDQASSIILLNESDTTTGYRIRTPNITPYLIGPREACRIYYDTVDSRWIVLSEEYNAYAFQHGLSGTFASFPGSETNDQQYWSRARSFRNDGSADLLIRGFKKVIDIDGYDQPVYNTKFLFNLSSTYKITINHLDGGAAAAEQVITDTGQPVVLVPGDFALLVYGYDKWFCSKIESKRAEETLSDAATIAFDVTKSRNAKVTITANRNFNFTNTSAGQRGLVRIIQDGSGSHTITWQRGGVASDVHYPGGSPPTLTTDGNAVDILEWYDDGSKLHLRAWSLDSQTEPA